MSRGSTARSGPADIEISGPEDLSLDLYRRVAWDSAPVRLGPGARARMALSRTGFMALLDNQPDLFIYGVTSGYGHRANRRLSLEERREQARRPMHVAMASFGETFPDRVARGIALARLGTLASGAAAVRPELADAVADMLSGGPMPPVPVQGQGAPGEILITSHLFCDLAQRVGTEEKESLALMNGSSAAAALVADAALAARRRLELACEIFALAAEAVNVPVEHFDAVFEAHWNDPHETWALGELRRLLVDGRSERRPYQAPVSARILPRMLGRMARAVEAAETAAHTSLVSITDNPVYLPSEASGDPVAYPWGRVLSNGGFHNAMAWPALDELAAVWADHCQIAERLSMALLDERIRGQPGSGSFGMDGPYLGTLGFAHVGVAEEARHHAQRTFLPGSEAGGFGQNDVAVPTALAWDKERRAAGCLEAALAMTAIVATQALRQSDRSPPPALAGLAEGVAARYPPGGAPRGHAEALDALAGDFRARVFGPAGP